MSRKPGPALGNLMRAVQDKRIADLESQVESLKEALARVVMAKSEDVLMSSKAPAATQTPPPVATPKSAT